MDIVIYTEGLPFDGRTPFEQSLGGSESAVAFMARELARRGHRVRVFCRCPRPGEYEGASYRDLSDFAEFAAEGGCDVFVCCRHLRGLAAPPRAKATVLWNHDVMVKEAARVVMSLMYRVDRLFVLSQFHREQLQRHLNAPADRYVVTRNGVDLALADEAIAGVPRDPNRLLYTSRPERGLDVLLELWPELRRRRPELTLGIAHYANPEADAHMRDYLDTLRRLAEGLPGVELLGPLTKRELCRELARAALLVYPSTFPEVSCISALEAAACGTPVVASRYCALKETVADQETGVLVPGDPRTEAYQQAFAAAVLSLLEDEERKAQLGRAARRRVEARHQWRDIAAEWEQLFGELVARPGAGERQTVSVCLIVKNAQGTLYRCLDSVRPIADEIIVCDTGSSDHTREIAREYTDLVFEIPWESDFGAARNRSIARASKDWILWIDADEYLLGGEHLDKYLRDNMYQGYVIRQHHHAIDARFQPDVPVRLFRNHRGIRFFGCVHEHPESALNQGVTPAVVLSDVHIAHDGYVTEAIRRQRFLRNLPLLVKDRQLYPERRLGLVFLARDCVHLARYELERTQGQMTPRSEAHLRRAIEIHQQHFRSPDDPLHGYSFPLYQSALELLGEGIEIEYALDILPAPGLAANQAGDRLRLARGQGAGQAGAPHFRRRVLDEAEARELLVWELERRLRDVREEEEFGFGE